MNSNPRDNSADKLDKLDELLKGARSESTQTDLDGYYSELRRLQWIENYGRKKFFHLRTHWSWFSFGWLTFLILFQVVVVLGVGLNWFDYRNYDNLLYVVIAENFGQVLGLGYIIVRYLFDSKK